MYKLKAVEDIEECACIWKKYIETSSIFDLWEVRKCFADSFKRNNNFLVLENDGEIQGILPLSWIEETNYYSFFPGESWHGKTWLEQNKIYAIDNNAFQILLDNSPGPLHIRYMTANSLYFSDSLKVDEINYHLYPGECNYSFDEYMQRFSGKSRKNLSKEVNRFYEQGAVIRTNDLKDIETLFEMNLKAFGDQSYFNDTRFFDSFQTMIKYLWDRNMLRITSVIIGDKTAAVDIGTIFNKEYVVLAGGTNPEFPGIAKLINFHHIEWACKNSFDKVDFLCGDFGWKERFHLSSKPLYEIRLNTAKELSIEHSKDRTGTYGC